MYSFLSSTNSTESAKNSRAERERDELRKRERQKSGERAPTGDDEKGRANALDNPGSQEELKVGEIGHHDAAPNQQDIP